MTKSAPKTEEFVLKPGHIHHGIDEDGNRHTYVGGEKDNDRVQLTEVQAKAFKDKFESVKEQKERLKLQAEVADLQAKNQKLIEAAAERGISVDELLTQITTKKPDPQPSVGTPEPTPENVTPAPVGSTSDPVNKAQAPAAKK